MNAGKSTILLQSDYNYRERGMRTWILVPAIDSRHGSGKVTSRIGIQADAETFHTTDNLHTKISDRHSRDELDCVLLDESQFLTRSQVRQLARVADELDIPVLTYGIRTDFQGNLFEGSAELLGWADSLVELKTICHCGRKATMNLRIDASGHAVKEGTQVQIGGNDRYQAVCRRHFREGMSRRDENELPLDD